MTDHIPRIAIAPWNLKGRGFMFLYHFERSIGSLAHFLPREDHGTYVGGLGALMLVDYQLSNVGPYKELLFIPGKFLFGQTCRHAISRIWVSSEDSVISGRANWGIPKDMATFDIQSPSKGREIWSVAASAEKPFFEADISYGGLPLPVHTSLIPMPIMQKWKGNRFFTRQSGYGIGRLARLDALRFDPAIFPDLSNIKPLIGLAIDPFRLTFPKPAISKYLG